MRNWKIKRKSLHISFLLESSTASSSSEWIQWKRCAGDQKTAAAAAAVDVENSSGKDSNSEEGYLSLCFCRTKMKGKMSISVH